MSRPDVFDALREIDKERIEWARASRAFTRLIDRVTDESTVKWLERVWEEELTRPMNRASSAWKLVIEARDDILMSLPITPEEAEESGLTTEEVISEMRIWQKRVERRREQVELEVEKILSDDFLPERKENEQ